MMAMRPYSARGRRRLVPTALAASAALHAGVLTAMAIELANPQPPALIGHNQIVRLQIRFAEPTGEPPWALTGSETNVRIMPHEAHIARRHFVHLEGLASAGLPAPAGIAERVPSSPPSGPPNRIEEEALFEPTHPPLPGRSPSTPDVPAVAAKVVRYTAGEEVATLPQLLDNVPPLYPPEAQRRGWQGVVVLRVHVLPSGRVGQVEVIQPSGHPVLDAAAVGAVRNWRYAPARLRGRPVATIVRQPIRFELPYP